MDLFIDAVNVTSSHVIFAFYSVYFPSFYMVLFICVFCSLTPLFYCFMNYELFSFSWLKFSFEFSQSKYIYFIDMNNWYMFLHQSGIVVLFAGWFIVWFYSVLLEFITFFLSNLFDCLGRTSSDVFWLFRREMSWVLCRNFSMSLKSKYFYF